jgi:serine/threonine protein phosphatase PrpC/CRP-like cAMP-binding protein
MHRAPLRIDYHARMRLAIEAHGSTDPGKKRKRNEDYLVLDEAQGIYAVCDGMGGHAAGDEASRIAGEAVREYLVQNRAPIDRLAGDDSDEAKMGAQSLIVDAMQKACADVWAAQEKDPAKRGMGSTMDCLVRAGNRLVLGHAGDSRVYLLRQGKVYRLTEDHTLAAAQVRQGFMTQEQADASEFKNVLLRAIGAQPSVQVDTLLLDLIADDLLLLCSDGLHGYLHDEELPNVLTGATPTDLPVRLIDLANERGGADNITALVIKVGGEPRESLPVSARIDAIRKLPLFRHLSYKETVAVLAIAEARSLAPNEEVVREGTPGDQMYVLSSGQVSVERAGAVIAHLGSGGFFGEMSLVDELPRSATVRTTEPTELLVLEKKDMLSLMQRDPVLGLKIAFCLAQALSSRLRDTNAELITIIEQDDRVPSTEPVPFTRGEG